MQEARPTATSQKVGFATAVAVVAAGLLYWHTSAEAARASQPIAHVADSTGLIAHVQETDGRQQTRVIVIDPAQRVMAVYEIGREKAEIKLLSSRNFSYDMQLLGHNSVDPSPEDVKKMLEMQ